MLGFLATNRIRSDDSPAMSFDFGQVGLVDIKFKRILLIQVI